MKELLIKIPIHLSISFACS